MEESKPGPSISLKETVEILPLPLAYYNDEGQLVAVNKRFEELISPFIEQASSKNILELLMRLDAPDEAIDKVTEILGGLPWDDSGIRFHTNHTTTSALVSEVDYGDKKLIALTLTPSDANKNSKVDTSLMDIDYQNAEEKATVILKQLIENYPNGSVTITDLDLNIRHVGGSSYKQFGFDTKNMVGKNIKDTMSERSYHTIVDNYDTLLKGDSFKFKIVYEGYIFIMSCQPFSSTGGDINRIALIVSDVTEVELDNNKGRRLDQIFRRSLNEIFVFDADSLKFVEVNDGALKNIGYSMEEMKEMTPLDIKDKVSPEEFQEILRPLLDGEEEKIIFETDHRRKNGSYYNVEVHLQLFDYPGEKLFVAIILDISHRLKTERKLKRSEAFLNKSQRIGKLGSWELDIDTRETQYSDEFLRLNNFELNTHPTLKDLISNIHPEDRDSVRDQFNDIISKSGQYSYEYRIESENGEYIWVSSTGEVYYDSISKTKKAVGIYLDITESKQREEEIRTLNQKLGLALDAAEIGIWEYEPKQNHVFWDSNMFGMYGMTATDYSPEYDSWNLFIYQEDREKFQSFWNEIMSGHDNYADANYRIVLPDDSIVYIQSHAYIERDQNKKAVRVVGLDMDVSDLKKAESTATTASKAKSEFLAQMTHELRTPLNGIIGYSELLESEKLSTLGRNYLNTINESSNYLLKLINEILDFSKIEAGKIDLTVHNTNISEITNEAIESVRYLAEVKDLKLSSSMSGAVRSYIKTDAKKLQQILVNLLGNSVKFTESGFVKLTIKEIQPSANNSKQFIRFSVEDSGQGIPENKQEEIFQKFSQAHSASPHQGTGLGLNISQTFAGLLGSEIKITSKVGEGSTFFFDLDPDYFEESDLVQERVEADKEINYALSEEDIKDGISVLIVEDNQVNALLTRTLLEKSLPEATIHMAENGMEAISKYIEYKPTFILMDIRMPLMNGIEASQAIRSMPEGEKVPIIALTAAALKEKRERTTEAGMNDFLTKPITSQKMNVFLQQLLPSKEIHKQNFKSKVAEHFEFSEEDLLSNLDGDRDLMMALMESARNYLLEIPLNIELALVKGEREDLKELSHKLKGMAQNLGFTQLAKVCRYLEENSNVSFKELRGEINYLRKATDFYLDLIESKYISSGDQSPS